MSFLSRVLGRSKESEEWTKAEGVLPVERALAEEHQALHGETLDTDLESLTTEFDPSQFTDVPALARALRDALGPRDAGIPVADNSRVKHEPELTPRDAIGKLLLHDAALKSALEQYVKSADSGGAADPAPLAMALSARFNALLKTRLMDEMAFRTFVEAGAIDALGDAPAGATRAAEAALFVTRANRELLEAAFPREISQMRDRRLAMVFDAARKHDTAALCLSGGGIRSSTFALGIMQGFARHNLLGEFDYLSTVSGGGLSGGWLTAWMRRDGAEAVHNALRTPGREKLQPEPEPVQGLRAFSHWLTPRAGAMSIDSWTVIATIIRNLLLNWLVLLPLLAGLVMLPRLLQAVLALDFRSPSEAAGDFVLGGVILGLVCLFGSAYYLERVRATGSDASRGKRGAATQEQVLVFFLVPRIAASVLIPLGLYIGSVWDDQKSTAGIYDAMMGALALTAGAAVVLVLVMAQVRRGDSSRLRALGRSAKTLVAGIVGYLLPLFAVTYIAEIDFSRELYVVIAPVIVLIGSVMANQLYIGLTSDEGSDAEREWAARANAWVYIVSIAWMVSSAIVLFGPGLLSGLWQKLTLIGVGGLSSALTIVLGKQTSNTPNAKPSTGDMISKAALSLAMPAVVACLIIALAAANNGTLNLICVGDTMSAAFKCSPPSDDSTSVPMLNVVANSKWDGVQVMGLSLAKELSEDHSHFPITDSAFKARVAADSGYVMDSHDLTDSVLSLDSVASRLIRRQSLGGYAPAAPSDTETGVLEAFRVFTATRNKRFVLQNDSTMRQSPSPAVVRAVQQELVTDSLLKADIVVRAAAYDSVESLIDSVRKAKVRHQPAERALWYGVLALMLVMMLAGWFFSTMVNTNTFSLHAMWKARTVRAFLGTTRSAEARNPNPFTGFDSDDDVPMRDLWPSRVSPQEATHTGQRSESVPPMHVLNVTLNLAAGRNLAWQQRKGESMTITPLHAGAAFTGYRPMIPHPKSGASVKKGDPGYGGPDGVSLGTAMAISGAAASPNDGSGTTALGAFLMTFFNARLGWWLGNPGAPGADTWQRSAPKQRLTPILSEMFGNTSDKSEYVYLSDGGHFENLALYEMVFRRCRFIVVSDAGADPDYTFEDLGNAVRKIRIDFGIPIEFDHKVNIKSGDPSAGAYWATAKIKYSAVDMPQNQGCKEEDYDGVLVYIKPAVYGVEPRDVVNYANLSPTFPQESSADQFFSESQFESYRALGSWIVDRLVANSGAPGAPAVAKPQRAGSLLADWPSLSPYQSKY